MPRKRSLPNLGQGLVLQLPAADLPASYFPTPRAPASSDKRRAPNLLRGERTDIVGRNVGWQNLQGEVFLCSRGERRAARWTSIRRRRESRERSDGCEPLRRSCCL